MNRQLTILLLAATTAYGQIDNPPTSVNITDATATGRAVLTATNAAAAATAIGLGATNAVQFAGVSVVDGNIRVLDGTNEAVVLNFDDASYFANPINFLNTNALNLTRDHLGLKRIVTTDQGVSGWITDIYDDTNATNPIISVGGQTGVTLYGPIDFSGANTVTNKTLSRNALGLGTTNAVTFGNITATGTLGVSNAATFATNVTINGNLSVGSFTTTTPSTWALDATQTAAATNGILALPSNANVLRITNANTISGVSNGVLGAFYFLINQSGTNVVISNSATITARGATNITLGDNQSATLITTTTTNATAH